jgi:hypothetical protein
MSEPYAILTAIIALVTLVSSGIALYVGMTARSIVLQVKVDLANFQIAFMKELDERYVRSKEYVLERKATEKESAAYRCEESKKLEGLQVEVHRDRDSIIVTLDNIVALLKERP